jgi:hypothetical protein
MIEEANASNQDSDRSLGRRPEPGDTAQEVERFSNHFPPSPCHALESRLTICGQKSRWLAEADAA